MSHVFYYTSSGRIITGELLAIRPPLDPLPARAELRVPGIPGIFIIDADRLHYPQSQAPAPAPAKTASAAAAALKPPTPPKRGQLPLFA